MLTRRKFIGTTLVAGAALTTSAQQARPQPASKRTIIDAQVHFWKANSPDWAWDPGAKPQLPEPFTIERALPMMDEAGVDRSGGDKVAMATSRTISAFPRLAPHPMQVRIGSAMVLLLALVGSGADARGARPV